MKSMKRVNIKCPYCGSQAFLRPASVVYGDRADDPNTKLYVCARYPFCNAYVAAHRDTRLPMGTLADPDLRRMRKEAHIALDRMMDSGGMTRKQGYQWLQMQLGLPKSETHIGHFSEFRCQQIIDLCDAFSQSCSRAV